MVPISRAHAFHVGGFWSAKTHLVDSDRLFVDANFTGALDAGHAGLLNRGCGVSAHRRCLGGFVVRSNNGIGIERLDSPGTGAPRLMDRGRQRLVGGVDHVRRRFSHLELAISGTCRYGILFCSICYHDPVHDRGKHIDQTVPYRPVGVRGIEPDRAVFMENSHAAHAGYLHFNRHHWLLLPFFSGQSHRDGAGVTDRTDYLYGTDMVLPSRLYH